MEHDQILQSDEEGLIRAAQRGHREAFAHLYEIHVERVHRYLLARLGQSADAEDVTADVFIRAMKSLSSYKIKGTPFIAWLYRIAHNEAINYLKKRSRHREEDLEEVKVITAGPEDETLSKLHFEEVSQAMEHLTGLQRQVLSLRFAGELSIAETATVMKRREGAIKALQHSGLRALRQILGAQGVNSRG